MLMALKYEFRKNLFSIIAMVGVLCAAELYFLGAYAAKSDVNLGISVIALVLISFGAYFFTMIFSVISFGSDLSNKSGYLTFMTPISTYSVIGAKLLMTFITGVVLVIMIFGFFAFDINMVLDGYGFKGLLNMFGEFLELMGVKTGTVILSIVCMILVFLVQFFLYVVLAYFSVSIATTILQNKNGKKFISGIIFVVLLSIVTAVSSKLGNVNPMSLGNGLTFMNVFKQVYPMIISMFCFGVAAVFGTGYLLNNKISL